MLLFSYNMRKILSFIISKHEISFVKLEKFRKMVILNAGKDIVRQSHTFIAKKNIIGANFPEKQCLSHSRHSTYLLSEE